MIANAFRRFPTGVSLTDRRTTMSIKHERPTPRRMMSQFDKGFLDYLPLFKQGFLGNEMLILYEEITGMGLHRDKVNILDVGSADSDWLQKTTSTVWSALDKRRTEFTALEPVTENPKLEQFCNDAGIKWERSRIEESRLPDESFDVILSTHCAYYYYNQPLAHEEMSRLLKPGGKLIVTLVSQSCVLNRLTEELLEPHKQFTLTAESYMTLMAKLKLFTLRGMRSYEGGKLDVPLFTDSEKHLRALSNILSRHRLPQEVVEHDMDRLSASLQKHQSRDRLNFIMFFEKTS